MIEEPRREPFEDAPGLRKRATRGVLASMTPAYMEDSRDERPELRARDRARRLPQGARAGVDNGQAAGDAPSERRCPSHGEPAARSKAASPVRANESALELSPVRLDPLNDGAWIRGEYRPLTALGYRLLEALVHRGGRKMTPSEINAEVQGGRRSGSSCRNLIHALRHDIGCKKDLIVGVNGGWRLSDLALHGGKPADNEPSKRARRRSRAAEK